MLLADQETLRECPRAPSFRILWLACDLKHASPSLLLSSTCGQPIATIDAYRSAQAVQCRRIALTTKAAPSVVVPTYPKDEPKRVISSIATLARCTKHERCTKLPSADTRIRLRGPEKSPPRVTWRGSPANGHPDNHSGPPRPPRGRVGEPLIQGARRPRTVWLDLGLVIFAVRIALLDAPRWAIFLQILE